ncbi:MAG TPA: hypothetical protein VM677_08460 [Actinokineospora sp.]|nr:hypothetical protein [Actinokineospora sp.]
MKTAYLRGYAERDTATDADPDAPIPFVLAREGRMDDGLDLRMDRLDLTRYLANPVLMYGHDYYGREALPIGRVTDPRVDGDRLRGGLVFDRADPFAVTVEGKVRNRFLNAVSVGFGARGIDADGIPESWELFETSVVPLPMDPGAIAEDGRARGPLDLAARLDAIDARLDALGRTTDPDRPPVDEHPDMAARARRLRLHAHLL